MGCRCGELTKAWKCFSSAFLAKGSLVNSSRPQPTDVHYGMTRYRGFHLNCVKYMEFSNLSVVFAHKPRWGTITNVYTRYATTDKTTIQKRACAHPAAADLGLRERVF